MIRSFSLLFAGTLTLWAQDPAPQKVDFVRDIQPLFKASCLKCHGAEKPKGQFRLDSRSVAMKGGVSGKVILPGNSKESLLLKLLLEKDDENRMPQKAPALAPEKIALLRAWIDQGAVWPDAAAGDVKVEAHWAYAKPVRREPPAAAGGRNAIDGFVRARLEKEGIAPSPEAERPTLIKRLYYDLLGLPAPVEEVDAFLADPAPDAYEKLVDKLLASPHFGERWGRHWLDKARYADSDGYEKDNNRPDAWRYRNWVIDAVNADLPFDRFTIEQLAGDLLPAASPMQTLATAFHRQTLTNTEGGTDKEQFRVEAVFDRAETTATVWLGLTVGCARCHNHKFDQISNQEYYQLFAFFNNGDETNADVPVSEEAVATYGKLKASHDWRLKTLETKLAAAKETLHDALPAWEETTRKRLKEDEATGFKAHPLEIVSVKPAGEVTFKKLPDGSVLAHGADPAVETYIVTTKTALPEISGFRLDVLADPSLPKKGPGRANGNFVLTEIRVEHVGPVLLADAASDFNQDHYLVKGALDKDPKSGWGIAPQVGKDHSATFRTKFPLSIDPEIPVIITLDQQLGDQHTIGRFRLHAITGDHAPLELADEVRKILTVPAAERTPAQRDRLLDEVATFAPATEKLMKELALVRKSEPASPMMTVRVISQRSKDPRETRMFRRGDFLQPQGPVSPGTLATLPPLQPRGETPDRLDLARWLVDPANPLTSRVVVNHAWANLFGQGLVRTPNDFGVRGERPTHPELLDWLATEYLRLGWSTKALIRTIVTSATYRQASRHRAELAERDPQNFLLSRQNRFRVEGEIVRDLTLGASGLLSSKIGGPSVFPPMPADIAALSYANSFKWKNSEGEDRYRRGLYTYFKRTAPYPGLTNFDCPDSNTTCVQRRTSNTPLQALTALNNEAFAEAARFFAVRLLEHENMSNRELAAIAFRKVAARTPTPEEVERLLKLLNASVDWYNAHPDEMKKAGKTVEEAAWTTVTRILLNLDEFLTRE
jgi:mono/diheme cytochrome c family protein